MDEQLPNLDEYLAILKRRKWQLILPILLLAPIAVVVALALPPVYRSTATILIEQQEIPPDLIRSTVTSFASQRIQVISQRVMTTRNLGEIIKKYNLYPKIRRKKSLNVAVAEMRRSVDLDMVSADVIDPSSGQAKKATIAFLLSFSNPSPPLTQKVTNEVVSLFLNENLRQREEAVEETTKFLRTEAERLATQIKGLEFALAGFKEEHPDNLPEQHSVNRELLARTEEHLRNNVQATRILQDQQLYLETELDKLDPFLGLGTSADGRVLTLSPEARLRELEARYVGMAARYTRTHPDRVQMERELAAQRKEVARTDTTELQRRLADLNAELAAARERYSPKHPDVVRIEQTIGGLEQQIAQAQGRSGSKEAPQEQADNPAYVQLRARLGANRLEVKGLLAARRGLESLLEEYEQRLVEGPGIELEYRDLIRDYDNAVAKYREVKNKEMEAELSTALESERKGERFTLIEPPEVPGEPEKPNRPAIMMLGIVFSFAGGFGNMALREILGKGIRGARKVQIITQAPPLAVIPFIPTGADRHRRVRKRAITIWAMILLIAVGVAVVHFVVMPLDLLWFTLVRQVETYLSAAGVLESPGTPLWNV